MLEGMTLAVFGAFLTVITGLMAWQATAIINAGKSIAVLQRLLTEISEEFKEVSEELKRVNHHDSEIAVLKSELANSKADVSLLFEKVKEIERNENSFIRGRQPG